MDFLDALYHFNTKTYFKSYKQANELEKNILDKELDNYLSNMSLVDISGEITTTSMELFEGNSSSLSCYKYSLTILNKLPKYYKSNELIGLVELVMNYFSYRLVCPYELVLTYFSEHLYLISNDYFMYMSDNQNRAIEYSINKREDKSCYKFKFYSTGLFHINSDLLYITLENLINTLKKMTQEVFSIELIEGKPNVLTKQTINQLKHLFKEDQLSLTLHRNFLSKDTKFSIISNENQLGGGE